MLKRRVYLLLMMAALVPCLALAQEGRAPLAQTLPAQKTIVYAHVDMKRALGQMAEVLTFMDADAGGEVVYQVKELYSILREVAAGYEFTPALLDRLGEVELYIVVMERNEPSAAGGGVFVPSFVIRAPDEAMAAEFVQEYKALLDRQREANPDEPALGRTQIEVERGELVGQLDGRLTVGNLGDLVVISAGNPEELWAAVMAAPEASVADTATYQRLAGRAGGASDAVFMANVGELIRIADASMKQAVEQMQKSLSEMAGQSGQGQFNPQLAMQMQMAQSGYDVFGIMKKLFSLDKLEWVGGNYRYAVDANRVFSSSSFLLSHGQPIAPLLAELLDGSGSFQPPPIDKKESLAMLLRVDMGRVISEVIQAVSEMGGPIGMTLQMQLAAAKAQLGVGLSEMLALAASDSYLYMDLAVKDVEQPRWEYNEQTDEWTETKTTTTMMVPDFALFVGLKDPAAGRDALAALATRLASIPEMSAMVKVRDFQGTNVYCFGQNVTAPEGFPDGQTSLAFVIVGRYLTFGTWDDVTTAIRQVGAAGASPDEALMSVIRANPNANFLTVMPKAWQLKNQELMAKLEGQNRSYDMMLKALEEAHLGLDDPEVEARIKDSLGGLIKAYEVLVQKGAAYAPEQVVMKGEHEGNFYEISSETEMVK